MFREVKRSLAREFVLQEELAREIALQVQPKIDEFIAKFNEFAEKSVVRTNRTKMVEVDLTKPHNDTPLLLHVRGRIYRWLTIERCDDSLNYRLKQTDGTISNTFRALEGARFIQHDFLDIYVSNPPSKLPNAVCRFIVGYWES